MKKIISLSLAVLVCIACAIPLSSCIGVEDVTVTYVLGYDDETITEAIPYFSLPEPPTPQRQGYEFEGWYYDEKMSIEANLTTPVIADTTLYAKWRPDMYTLSERVANEVITSSVKIRCDVRSENMSYIGSGVVIYNQGGNAYILTNDHVVKSDIPELKKEYTVYDSMGKSYTGTLECSDPKYDLALISIKGASSGMTVTKIAVKNPKVGDFIISVGNPDGIFNTVTYGNVVAYRGVSASSGFEVGFEVFWHDAPIYHGSSGGAVYNDECLLVGINFAGGGEGKDGYYTTGAFVQMDRVREFLENENFDSLLG